ncbi:hypothetical protein J524_3251 [Acinetobacter baumannii 496487]|uniref:Uncharacterized protein n=1 Tax=Acinetobacter baumannii 1499986 TaxID=1310673 RepID=A0A836LXP8_ACIBA|nr:hypothetical protein J552_3977 [Acinetobacter baumannii 951631]EXE69042.1 hypothetical protein J585_1432 [Acinetobacter baumannii 397971]EXG13127.1 hypothetical protein J712_0337 [Acinetobacter baumannii 722310]EXH54224.1 hypothetical protein J620_3107 [Acinetobacter baumannii 1533268]EXH90815.1 hypothetical protein J606_0171 [Acinetobacter baumannii 318814]EXI01013.1 hypothetical protein J618_1871 [Acinetobacter baumannii 607805]EXI03818.1 hypothetical protein J639_2241 [Acinetobacter bau
MSKFNNLLLDLNLFCKVLPTIISSIQKKYQKKVKNINK